MVDVVGFHWAVGVYRIREDVPDPLLWDIDWLAVIGLPLLAAGLWPRRRGEKPPFGRSGALLVGTSAITGGCLAYAQRPA